MIENDGAQRGVDPDALAKNAERKGLLSRFFRSTRETRAGFREVSHVLDILRAPFFVSILGVVAFAFPGQVHEIYRLFAEDLDFENYLHPANLRFGVFFVMLYITGYVIWYAARVLTYTDEKVHACMGESQADGWTARWGPRLMGGAPALGAAYGLAMAEYSRDGEIQTPALYGAAAIAALIGLYRIWSSYRRTSGDPEAYVNPRKSWFRVDVRIFLGLILLCGIGFMMTQPIAFTQAVGALTIFSFFLIALVYGWSHLTFAYDRYAIPGVTILIGGALTWSLLDLNDNHFLRTLPQTQEDKAARALAARTQAYGPPLPITVQNAFTDWLAERKNRKAYDDAELRYPVYVIAAQGGGLYAAYQTAHFLARLQDECPTFAQHVFAISGVSGGSVGAATFTALAKEYAVNQPISDPLRAPCGVPKEGAEPKLAEVVDRMFEQDLLTPVVSGLLFGDFTARFSPVPIPAFDRARALEGAFERSWTVAFGRVEGMPAPAANRLEEGILSYWEPDSPAPILFLNTVATETGRRLIFSPVEEITDDLPTYAAAARPRGDGSIPDVRLSTAAVISARFPYITPAASMRLRTASEEGEEAFPKVRLVDGGYFEDSGIDTAVEILDAMFPADRRERRRIRSKIDVRLIVLDLTQDRFRPASYALGEAVTPLKALLNTRSSRASVAQSRARRYLRAPCRYTFLGAGAPPGANEDEDSVNRICLPSEVEKARVWSVSLNDYEYDFQLGWILSRDTLSRVRAQLGAPLSCGPAFGPFDPAVAALEEDAALAHDKSLLATGVSVVDEGAPATDDAVSQHNSCVGYFALRLLRRDSGRKLREFSEEDFLRRARPGQRTNN